MLSRWMRAGAVAAFALLTTGAEAQTSLGTAYGMTQQAMVQARVTTRLQHSQDQVTELFQDSLDLVLPHWHVSQPVRLDLTVMRFPDMGDHDLSQSVTFRLQPVDPGTGQRVARQRTVRLKLDEMDGLSHDRRALVRYLSVRIMDELTEIGDAL